MFPLNDENIPALAQTIQLAIAPVFLLTAIGGFLSAITTRLGRVIDRARKLESTDPKDDVERSLIISELSSLDRRMLLANRAVGLSVSSALTICTLIAVLFVSAVSPFHPDQLVPVLFILAILLLMAALLMFALEIRISIRTVRVRAELIYQAPRPPGDISFRS
ncbi:DUF2721 domain-containing protein [Sandaracinobacter neustonicus]|uniref:DUF2721 domain-containing protein n=1 Tax=Sandaracinobacter neustonicus TaxID=1715348 RepID=A0A501XRW9_9SPHN|nr:DUF2721 domain-containing protein [Sandaracinobacter neustonicus]TPE63310.1 DUF2721 domain-containing protein [Sandaracinobacter neustonicus]